MSGSGAWGKVITSPGNGACSLSDVMSEELALKLQAEEDDLAKAVREKKEIEEKAEKELIRIISTSEDDTRHPCDTSRDMELAMMLQAQFDAELESHQVQNQMKKEEKLVLNFNYAGDEVGINGNSKARRGQNDIEVEEEEDEEEDDVIVSKTDTSFPCRSAKGYIGRGQNIKTKHDLEAAARRNAGRILDCMDPTFNSGDVEAGEHLFSDPVYNALRRTAMNSDQRRTVRLQEKKDHSTAERALDERTRRVLFQFETQDRLRELGGIIATGKESIVMHARGGSCWSPQAEQFPEECAVKIYKTTLNEFKTRMIYVNGDFRFSKDEFRKQNPRKVIRLWAEKEMMNLKRIRKSGILCPKPVQLSKHVLVMSFIGRNGVPADKLSEAVLPPEDWQDAYEQSMTVIRRLYNECNLVHADFSGYNLLWWDDRVWVIDVSQSVEKIHPHALSFLRRDCENVSKFFAKKGVFGVKAWEDHFNELTGLRIEGRGDEFMKNFAAHIAATQDYESDCHHLTEGVQRREFAFDYFFERSQSVKERQQEEQDDEDEEEEEEEEEEEASKFVNPPSSRRE